MKKILNKIWKNKGILFLLLITLYAVTAGMLHLLYQGGAFSTKHYKEDNYNFAVTKMEEEDCLEFNITYCSENVKESAKEGDVFTIDNDTIHYHDFVYKWHGQSNHAIKIGAYDYYVEFPNGEKYAYNKEDALNYYRMPDEGSLYLYSEAPDSKYNPEMIRSAILVYQKYDAKHHLFETEEEIVKITLLIWLCGSIALCLMNYLMKWQMFWLSRKLYYETTEAEKTLEPSEWSEFCYVAGCVALLAYGYIGMIFWYVSMH